jgi:hypothetical protein
MADIRRFQFSMRDLFICVTLVGVGLADLLSVRGEGSLIRFSLWCLSGAIIGVGFGTLFKRRALGLAIGVGIQAFITAAMLWNLQGRRWFP